MNRIDDLTTSSTLRSLDVADRQIDPSNPRARADLEAILATSTQQHPSSAVAAVPGEPRRALRTVRRFAVVGGMAAALTAGVVMLPALTGGDRAFATWTAAPTPMSAEEQADASASCLDSQRGGAGSGAEYADDLSSAEAVIAERRGVWTTVVLAGTDGFSALCITDESANLFADATIGSIGTPTDYTEPGSRDVVATTLGAGTMRTGDVSLIAGGAGSDVVSVVYLSQTHGSVTATVNHGHFALWFPGDELENASTNGVDVEVTYRDGTTDTGRLTL